MCDYTKKSDMDNDFYRNDLRYGNNSCLYHLCCKKRKESKSSKTVTTVIYHSDSKESSENKDNTNCKEVTVTNYEEP